MALLPKLRARLVLVAATVLIAFQLALPVEILAQRTRRPRRGGVQPPVASRGNVASTVQHDARVGQVASEYLHGYFAFYPSEATERGVHEFDNVLEARDPPVKILRMALLGDEGAATNAQPSDDATEDRSNIVEFTVLATGTMSGYEGVRMVELVTNESDWQRAWGLVGGGRPQPEINFNVRAVVVVYQGQKPTGGYSIEIAEIRRDGTVLAVKVNERRPAFGDVTTQVITSPFVAVSIPRPPQGASVRLADEGKRAVKAETQQNRKIKVRPRRRRSTKRRR